MRVYVDFDDVLCETARTLSRLANELFGRDVPYERITRFNLRLAFRLDAGQIDALMRRAHEPAFLLALPAAPGAEEGLRRLVAAGHTVCVVTGRPVSTEAASREWLARHGLPPFEILTVDKYGRANGERTPDGRRALSPREFADIPFDAAVEDSPEALDLLAPRGKCRVLVFDRPWNAAYPLAPNMVRASGWPAVADVLEFSCFQTSGESGTLSPANEERLT